MLYSLQEIESHLNRSADLNPSFAQAGALRVLGVIQQKLPGILGGSNERARDYFERSIAAAPNEPMNYLFLSKLYSFELRDPKKSTEELKKNENFAPISPTPA